MGFSFKHFPEDAPLSGQAKGSTKRRRDRKRAAQGSRPKDGSGPAQDTNRSVGHTTTPPEVHSAAESLDTATARGFDEIAARPAPTAAATSTTCPPSWFAQHLPGHERDRAIWVSALPDQESDLHVPLQRVLMEKLHMVRRLTRWKERVVDREQADKRALTAASALAASVSNAAAADEVTEAKAAVSRLEKAAFAARADLVDAAKSNSSGDTNDAHRILIDTLTRANTDVSRDLEAARLCLREAKVHAIDAANLARADAAAKETAKETADAAADAAAVAAADAEANAAAEARAAGIHEPATATSVEIGAAITRAKAAVAHYLGVHIYCTSHMLH